MLSIFVGKSEKLQNEGIKVHASAMVAIALKLRIQEFELHRRSERLGVYTMNQRQRRKLWSQNPHLRKKAA